jgi:aromatic-amino-acid transaminase
MQEYIPIDGIPGFNVGSQRLIFGKDSQLLKDGRVVTAQSLSGTGALRIGF